MLPELFLCNEVRTYGYMFPPRLDKGIYDANILCILEEIGKDIFLHH